MSYSFDVTAETFQTRVIEASRQTPVLVDFWAAWCGPCKTLMPMLQKLVDEYQGQFLLAKVEIDQQPDLASHFGVRSVPTVKLIKNAQLVDEFMGALPESELRAFLERHRERESDRRMQQALAQYQQQPSGQELEQLLQAMQQIAQDDPENLNNQILLAEVLLNEQRNEDARKLLNCLPLDKQLTPEVAALLARLEFVDTLKNAPDPAALQQRIDSNPKDSEARYQLSAHYLNQGDYAAAMEQLLEIIRRDRAYQDDAGRKGLLKIFDLLGNQGELVSKYRRLLAQALN
jgi:putative thioredoxin